MPEVCNVTILLIPKMKPPQELSHNRPISLCNVLYKICSKVIAKRQRTILDEIIFDEQISFVPGRLISDNVIMAYECIHYLKRKKGKLGACAVKLDMEKVYNRVEQCYLEEFFLKLGFARSWVNTIMRCVRSVSFSIKINGQFSAPFKPSCGIWQGDSISSYLFVKDVTPGIHLVSQYGHPDKGQAELTTPDQIHMDYLLCKISRSFQLDRDRIQPS